MIAVVILHGVPTATKHRVVAVGLPREGFRLLPAIPTRVDDPMQRYAAATLRLPLRCCYTATVEHSLNNCHNVPLYVTSLPNLTQETNTATSLSIEYMRLIRNIFSSISPLLKKLHVSAGMWKVCWHRRSEWYRDHGSSSRLRDSAEDCSGTSRLRDSADWRTQ